MQSDGCGYTAHEDLTWRDVNGELVALNVKSGEYHTFNEVGRIIWLGLAERLERRAIVERLVEEFDVSAGQAEADVERFLSDLEQRGLLMRSHEAGTQKKEGHADEETGREEDVPAA